MDKQRASGEKSRGFTAIFVVIFSTMILSIIAIGFVSMMVREQSRSTDDELSESAYDSALAGVEDGKRVLAACNRDGAGSQACRAIQDAECDTVQASGILGVVSDSEVLIQSDILDDNQLNQAYTCVIIRPYTDAYTSFLGYDDSAMIALRQENPFNKVVLSWYSSDDISSGTSSLTYPASPDLTAVGAWGYGLGHAPLMKAQLMQYDASSSIKLDTFNDNDSAHTLYLYPLSIGSTTADFASDNRRTGGLAVSPVDCAETVPVFGYACTVTLSLPDLPDGASGDNRSAYLRLSNFYGAAHYEVRLMNDTTPVRLTGVQPSIDSTGRANDIFRRVEARVELSDSSFPYPRATVDIANNFCKAFGVKSDGIVNLDACDPSTSGD